MLDYDGALSRGWYILRYHRASQLLRRGANVLRQRFGRASAGARYQRLPAVLPAARRDEGLVRMARAKIAGREALGDRHAAQELLAGRYRFLNHQRELPDPIDWRLQSWPEAPHLWRFHLHYHDFLLDLLGDCQEEPRRVWEIVGQWIEANRLDDRRVLLDAWHPYCISRRLPVWIAAWLAAPPPEALNDEFLVSVYQQTRYLADHLEKDLGGNHLLENLRGLLIAACFLDCPESAEWRNRAAKLLQRELQQQILPHGEHFERSPMYHAAMLDAVLDLRDVTAGLMPDLSRRCAEAAQQMAAFLGRILHPDQEIPLFSDSAFGETPPTATILKRAGAALPSSPPLPFSQSPTPSSTTGDYWTFHDGGDFLIFDTGPVGPDHLPAHAHADLLGFEASLHGRRVFCDRGVFGYSDDAMRRYCRSSTAHNVLVIDGLDQCDLWSRFRMGYRGWPREKIDCGETAGFHWARASHNAYRRCGVPAVGRWLACRPGGCWICLDWADGRGRHELTSHLHLHPEIAVEPLGDDAVRIRLPEAAYVLRFIVPGAVTIDQTWHCPGFGLRQQAPVIEWRASADLPALCGWYLAPEGLSCSASLVGPPSDPRIRWTDAAGSIELRPFDDRQMGGNDQ